MHIDDILCSKSDINGHVMSFIRPYLETLEDGDIRTGVLHMTRNFLRQMDEVSKYTDVRSFSGKALLEYLKVVALLDILDSAAKSWDRMVETWTVW